MSFLEEETLLMYLEGHYVAKPYIKPILFPSGLACDFVEINIIMTSSISILA